MARRLLLLAVLLMAFDMGFNFRGSAGYVTDPSYCAPALGEAYPHTYTNADGKSINAGWDGGALSTADRRSTADPRVGGINYNTSGLASFRVDLSSGSAPGAGTYLVDFAFGDWGFGHAFSVMRVKDDTTIVIGNFTGTNTSQSYFNPTGAQSGGLVDTDDWDDFTTPQSVAFASTTARCEMQTSGDAATLAHFRLTLQEAVGGGGVGDPFFAMAAA